MKKTFLFFTFAMTCLSLSSCLKDLLPDHSKQLSNQVKAKELMRAMGEAHQIHLWKDMETYQVQFDEEFYGFIGKQGNPFSEDVMSFNLSYIPGDFNGQMEILNGKEAGKVWGIQSGQVYEKMPNGKVLSTKNKDMKFWIPTYQYFIEFPLRIQEANAIDYIGTNTINGKNVEGFVASWNTIEPQKDIDQYLVWLDVSTKRIVRLDYTIRDYYGFISGSAYYKDYYFYDDLPLPKEMPVESSLVKKGYMHKMSIKDFKRDVVSKEALMPM